MFKILLMVVCVGDATVTMCHRYTPPEHLPICTKMADFVIVATGIPNLITKDMIKPGYHCLNIDLCMCVKIYCM